jgi:hypothetical protein
MIPFDLNSLLSVLAPLLASLANVFKTPAPLPVTPVPDNPLVPAKANQAIKDLQAFLNTALSLNPPLRVDGWLGPKTDAAIEAGIARIRSFGIG